MRLHLDKENIQVPHKKTRFAITWRLEPTARERSALESHEIMDEVLLALFPGEANSPTPVHVSDLIQGLHFETSDLWWLLDVGTQIRRACGDLARLLEDIQIFSGSEIIEIVASEVKED